MNKVLSYPPVPMVMGLRWLHQGLQAEKAQHCEGPFAKVHSTILGLTVSTPSPPSNKALLNCEIPRLQKALYNNSPLTWSVADEDVKLV